MRLIQVCYLDTAILYNRSASENEKQNVNRQDSSFYSSTCITLKAYFCEFENMSCGHLPPNMAISAIIFMYTQNTKLKDIKILSDCWSSVSRQTSGVQINFCY